MLRFILTLLLFCSLILPLSTVYAQEDDDPGQGVVQVRDNFLIFPENQPGNSFYVGKKWMFSKDGLILRDIVQGPEGYVYLGIENDKPVIGFAGEQDVKIEEVPGGFFHLKAGGWSKIYRSFPRGKIQDLLPRSKTASGLVFNGKNKAAFFHISSGKTIETEDGKLKYLYTFKVHMVSTDSARVHNVSDPIDDYDPVLKLNWVEDDVIGYTLSDGQKYQIKLN